MKVLNYISSIENLPRHVQEHVKEYIEFLMDKYNVKEKKNRPEKLFNFKWEDSLSDIKNTSSVDLQHKANQLR